jgi:CBS domain containing-hemolysin-like protein
VAPIYASRARRHPPARRSPNIATALGLLAVVLLVGAQAFFVAVEFALVAVDRTRLEQRAAEGSRRAQLALGLIRQLSHHLSGAQLGITVTSLVLGFIAEPVIAELLSPVTERIVGEEAAHRVALVVALLLATVVQMVLGELVPKTLAIARALPTAVTLAAPMRGYDLVFGWLISALDRAANWTVRRLGIEPAEELSNVRSLPELDLLFQASADEGLLDQRSTRLLSRSIRFGEKTAADALVPRTAMVAVPIDSSASELVRTARHSGRSRFPVYGEDLDDIRGVVHVKQVQARPPEERSTTSVRDLMTEAVFVPETVGLEDVLVDIQRSRSQLVLVADEYGGTAGLLTLEDVIEEIVGDIADEYDVGEPELTRRQQPGEWVLGGTLHPDEVFDACGFEIPEGEYETLAGFVLDRLGRIPERPGDTFDHDGWRFEVVEMDRKRVATVRVVAPGEGRR